MSIILIAVLVFTAAISFGVYINQKFPAKGELKNDSFPKNTTALNDAAIIALASEHKNGISVAAVCLASNASAVEVKNKMEALREQGLLYLSVDENGAEKYTLTDTSLISDKHQNRLKK
ncbi:hypothetical protein [Flammeovirga sp. SJP92]|uniref:hypothetical protein n=1 Tax=Flammeovirga sp. SJP92 TaxID=1775430 RepID=UPI000789212C|nr:hypothetical protein [Flammeovirga sp. SJP92]KXX70182.1 hypothetical protein AVL50_15065 [Flammeovirga sp. SJP92]